MKTNIPTLRIDGSGETLALWTALRTETNIQYLAGTNKDIATRTWQIRPCNLDIDGRLALRFVFSIEQAFGFVGIARAQALLLMRLFVFDIPAAAGPTKQSKFVSHVAAHVDEAATSRIPSTEKDFPFWMKHRWEF